MLGEPTAEVSTIIGKDRKLGYAQEFRQMIHEHPGIVHTAMELTKKAEEAYSPPDIQFGYVHLRWNSEEGRWEQTRFADHIYNTPLTGITYGRGTFLIPGTQERDPETGLEVTVLGKSNRIFRGTFGRIDRSSYLKMTLGDHAFFVKKATATNNVGFSEFTNTIRAKGVLQNTRHLQVVEAQLGYADKEQSWFVSKWNDLEKDGFFTDDTLSGGVNDYGEFQTNIPETEEQRELLRPQLEKIERMKRLIESKAKKAGMKLYDLDANLFYNPDTNKFFLIDVTTGDKERLNQKL